jgi:hypothetical protein
MAKKWNKVIARIQALENAIAGLLTGKSATRKKAKRKSAKKKVSAKAAPKAKAPSKTKAKKKTAKPARAAKPARKSARKPRKANSRIAVAQNAPILPLTPLPSL